MSISSSRLAISARRRFLLNSISAWSLTSFRYSTRWNQPDSACCFSDSISNCKWSKFKAGFGLRAISFKRTWHFRALCIFSSPWIFSKLFASVVTPWTISSSKLCNCSRSFNTSIVLSILTLSVEDNSVKKSARAWKLIFQNNASKLSSSSLLSLNSTELLNLKCLSLTVTLASFSAWSIGGLWESAEVIIRKIFLQRSLPSMDKMKLKMYSWFGVRRTWEAWVTKAIPLMWRTPFGAGIEKNCLICLTISLSLLRPWVLPKPGVSIMVNLCDNGEPCIG